MAIRVRIFGQTGARLQDIILPLDKAEASLRLQRRIAKGGDPFAHGALADLDSGVPFTTIMKLFDRAEIENAALARLKEVEPGSDEYRFIVAAMENLTALLAGDTRAWRAAQGADPALGVGDRFGIRRNPESQPETHGIRQPELAKVSSHRDPLEEDLRWQKRAGEARETARERGWRTTGMTGDFMQMHHPGRPGDELAIDGAGNWRHSGRDVKTESGGAGQLAARLDKLVNGKKEDVA